eukprot:scaffold240777_cov18-Tisochrysis_lutea.AAC.2
MHALYGDLPGGTASIAVHARPLGRLLTAGLGWDQGQDAGADMPAQKHSKGESMREHAEEQQERVSKEFMCRRCTQVKGKAVGSWNTQLQAASSNTLDSKTISGTGPEKAGPVLEELDAAGMLMPASSRRSCKGKTE